jgi:hypothetical protein
LFIVSLRCKLDATPHTALRGLLRTTIDVGFREYSVTGGGSLLGRRKDDGGKMKDGNKKPEFRSGGEALLSDAKAFSAVLSCIFFEEDDEDKGEDDLGGTQAHVCAIIVRFSYLIAAQIHRNEEEQHYGSAAFAHSRRA